VEGPMGLVQQVLLLAAVLLLHLVLAKLPQ
jgi:hypothetical protein